MNAIELLAWARGTGWQIATAVFLVGVTIRLIEMWMLGRKPDLSEPRAGSLGPGWRTVFSRSLPMPGAVKRVPLVYIGGYAFHLGFFITFFFYTPHILFLRGIFGVSWPGLPPYLIDFLALVSIAALVALMIHRFTDPVRRMLTFFEDYVSWLVTLLPLLTGYLALHRLFFDYTLLLALHILSVEVLLVVFPFTKLMHAITFILARWYNGAAAGRKGVSV